MFVPLFVTLLGACVPDKSTDDEPDPTATGAAGAAGAKKDDISVSNDTPSNVIIRKPGDPLTSSNSTNDVIADDPKTDEPKKDDPKKKEPKTDDSKSQNSQNTGAATEKSTSDGEIKIDDDVVADDNFPKPPSNNVSLSPEAGTVKAGPSGCNPMYASGTGGVNVAIRKGAGSQYEAIGTLAPSESVVPVIAFPNWIVIQKGNVKGYVYKKYLGCSKNQVEQSEQISAGQVQKKLGDLCK